jgi:hypothetical protein
MSSSDRGEDQVKQNQQGERILARPVDPMEHSENQFASELVISLKMKSLFINQNLP